MNHLWAIRDPGECQHQHTKKCTTGPTQIESAGTVAEEGTGNVDNQTRPDGSADPETLQVALLEMGTRS
jgi:hypothetical protein